ncbi:MAG: phosphotransferase [Oscillospiraceae bacterium]|nr:phosphotransferase [Oscillospiraceae bacterium]
MFDDNVLEYASKFYDFEINTATWINSGSNRVYKILKNGQNFYLRISTRKFEHIAAENDWINYLKDSIKVPILVKSNNNKLIESYQANEKTYVICLYHELPGVYWDKNDATTWNETVFRNWGNIMGKMHRMTKNYQPPEGSVKRPLFEDNLMPLEYYEAVPSVYAKMAQVQKEILELPRDIDSYGLIHSDFAQQNLLIHNNEISVLDFDDCEYGFFALDIGIALYHAIWWGLPEDNSLKNDFAFKIIKNFMLGYETENRLSDYWLKKIVLFMKYRQISALKWHLGYYKPKSLDEVVYNDYFKIYYDFGANIKFIENDIFYEECKIDENDFINPTK